MANPQPDRFTKFSNELFDQICMTRIPGEARQIFDCIARKTYGFNKKFDAISLSQFEAMTGMKKPSICRALKKLIEMNLIIKKANCISEKANGISEKDSASIQVYGINKDYEEWNALAKKLTFTKKLIGVSEKVNKSFTKKLHTKDNVQKTILQKKEYKRHENPVAHPTGAEKRAWFNENIRSRYPARDGVRRTLREAENWFVDKFDWNRRGDLLKATENLAASKDAQTGFGIKDCIRWLRPARGLSVAPWEDWVDVDSKQTAFGFDGVEYEED